MKNTTDEALSVSSMFLSPNMEEKGVNGDGQWENRRMMSVQR